MLCPNAILHGNSTVYIIVQYYAVSIEAINQQKIMQYVHWWTTSNHFVETEIWQLLDGLQCNFRQILITHDFGDCPTFPLWLRWGHQLALGCPPQATWHHKVCNRSAASHHSATSASCFASPKHVKCHSSFRQVSNNRYATSIMSV